MFVGIVPASPKALSLPLEGEHVVKRTVLALLGLLIATLTTLGFGVAAHAADTGIGFKGIILGETGKPLSGVKISAKATAGAFKSSSITGADGTWKITVPTQGQYVVSIDVSTLPKGEGLTDPKRQSSTLLVYQGYNRVGFPIGPAETNNSNFFGQLSQLLVDGAIFGLIIALAAIGLSLIYGTTGLTNFAHGEIVSFGALSTYFFNVVVGIPLVISIVLGVITTAAIMGWFQDRILWRPLRKRGTGLIAMLVVSIGLGIFLRYLFLFRFNGNTKTFREYAGQAGLNIGPISETPKALIAAAVGIAMIVATVFWLLRSRVGKASRAVSDNPALASASGIDVEKVISTVWILGAGLASFSGVMLGLTEGIAWNMGQRVLLLTFAAVTLGGLGSAFGAIVGGLVIGILLDVSTLWIAPELKNVGALVVLIIILLVRPQGILGRRERVG